MLIENARFVSLGIIKTITADVCLTLPTSPIQDVESFQSYVEVPSANWGKGSIEDNSHVTFMEKYSK
jgi:hypothetical protein